MKKILTTKSKIETDIDVLGFIGSTPKGRDFDEFVRCVGDAMPKSVQRAALKESLLCLAGQPLTQELLSETAFRLAGNLDRLAHNTAVTPWTHQAVAEWLPVHLVGAQRAYSHSGKPLARYTLVVLGGLPAGMKVEKTYASRFLPLLARYVGFTKLEGDYPYSHFTQFVGLRMRVLFDPALSQGAPVFDSVKQVQPPSLLEWNRTVLAWRARKTFKCPKGFKLPQHPCHLCHIGLDQCKAAVHPRTFLVDNCVRCHKDKFHNPASVSGICIDCEYEKIKGEHKE